MRILTVLLVLAQTLAVAQTQAPDIENMTIEEIESLPPEVVQELPAIQMFEKLEIGPELDLPFDFWRFVIGFYLSRLYYTPHIEGEEQIARAVEAFQRDIDADVTGILTLGQFEELNRRATRRFETKVYASNNAYVSKFEDYSVTAKGTWVLEDEQIGDPVNTVEINCIKPQDTCKIIQASVTLPSIDSTNDTYYLSLDTQVYKIISWTDDEVIARPYQTNKCRATTLTINVRTQEVYEVTRNNNQEACKFGDLMELPPLEGPRIARLVKGYEATRAYWEVRTKQYTDYVNSTLRDKFKPLFGQVE
jgi:hypothetical protein